MVMRTRNKLRILLPPMRKLRDEEMFQAWLEQRNKYSIDTFASFRARCEAGEIEGFETTVSDTVTGDAEVSPASEKRDELPEGGTQIQAPPNERPGRQGPAW